MEHRGVLTDDPALRMAAYLADTDTVRTDGVITDVPAMLSAYMARARVSRQTAYTDFGRLIRRGLVRQLQAAAPGYRARYRLSAPAAMVAAWMPGLPPELARAIGQEDDEAEPMHEATERGENCGGLDPSPYMREGSPPSPCGNDQNGARRRTQYPREDERSGNEETDKARAVLKACTPHWCAQGAPAVDSRQVARLEALVAVTLRHVPPGEVIQLLTWRVAGARDLAGVLSWRLGRAVNAARHSAPDVMVDETGVRYTEMLSARPGNRHPTQARVQAIAAARAAAEAARQRFLEKEKASTCQVSLDRTNLSWKA
jgi:hypothetical protein